MADKPATTKELRGMAEPDLRASLQKLADEQWQARQKVREGAMQQTHRFGIIRRQIARIQTVMNEQRRRAAVKQA
jgi:large subunit ribosomal protein L29